MYFLGRSDPIEGWGLPEILKMAFKCLSIALDDLELDFFGLI